MPSGSRSLYGGIAIAEWALIRGCAVALPGKGTDTGFHLLTPDLADNVSGVYGPADALGRDAQFAVHDTHRLREYVSENPHRVATKHAHSQINPERLWGEFGLQGIEFAFWALNDRFPNKRFTRKNTIVIAAGASNGGGMALRAAEDDRDGLIDAVVVTEPNIQPRAGRFTIKFGTDARFDPDGRTIYDSITTMSVYAPCAALSPTLAGTPFFGLPAFGGAAPDAAKNRCAALRAKELISGETVDDQAASALAVIRAHGYAAAQDWGIASHEWLSLWRALQPTYAASYGRFAVQENVCGVSFAAVDATLKPAPLADALVKRLFADSTGIPATGGIGLIADWAKDGPILENFAISRVSGVGDLNFESALCFRALQTGEGLTSARDWLNHARVWFGTREVQTSGRLHGKPTIIIHGRRDALVFPNLHSRAYYGLNQEEERGKSRVRYIEVTTGQHFDTFISGLFLGPSGAQFVPLHYYFVKAMDNMYAHLTNGEAVPPSQVVRPTPRGSTPYTEPNPPSLTLPSLTPADEDRITFSGGVLTIPE
jgi:hydroxybutyrate-dimer hydrolase